MVTPPRVRDRNQPELEDRVEVTLVFSFALRERGKLEKWKTVVLQATLAS